MRSAAAAASVLSLGLLGAQASSPSCYQVDFEGTKTLSSPLRTVFSYTVMTSAGCAPPSVFSLSSKCATTECGAKATSSSSAFSGLSTCSWASLPSGSSSSSFELVVAGEASIATGQWSVKAGSDVSLGYTCVPGCDDVTPTPEPTLPNVGEPCVLVVPASITVPDTGRTQVQVSLQAQPDGEVSVAIASDCAFLNRCTLTFDPSNWNVPQTFAASNDPANPDRSCAITLTATGTNDCEGTINVTKADAPKTESVSYGDPYVFTFDGVRFQLSQTTSGDDYYYLLRQPNGELIVQSYVQPCAIGECNNGAAIRYRSGYVRVNMARDGTLTLVDNGSLAAEGGSISQPVPEAYLLTLNTQAAIRLTAELIPSMNVYSLRISIRLGASYRGNVAGLVGNFNRNRNDERGLPDGTQAPDVATLENGWKVPAAENLFTNPSASIGTLFGAQPYTAQTFPFVCEAS